MEACDTASELSLDLLFFFFFFFSTLASVGVVSGERVRVSEEDCGWVCGRVSFGGMAADVGVVVVVVVVI